MVKIGIIDSGINKVHEDSQSNIEGIFLKKDELTNQITKTKDITDRIGHGSECFKIISSMVTGASYYIVKIFDHEMIADIDILAAAIHACIAENVNIINISAGVVTDSIPTLLRIACDEAYNNNITILSAKHNLGTHCYPAHYTNVIGVGFTDLSEDELYTHKNNNDIDFYTSAKDLYPEEITWSDATSFACAKMTAYSANILKLKGNMKMEELTIELVSHIKQNNH